MSRQGGGRIRPHERDTDDTIEILGANIAVSAEHTTSVKATEQQDLNNVEINLKVDPQETIPPIKASPS
jgi:hypothetical protein